MKKCKKCNVNKEESEFGFYYKTKDKLNYQCKICKICKSEYYKSRKYDRRLYQHNYKRLITDERKEYLKKYLKIYRKIHNSTHKEARRMNIMVRRALKYKNETKVLKSKEILGWTKEQFIDKIGKIQASHDIDHKIPISWFLKDTPVSIINHLDNLQQILSIDNRKKRNSYYDNVPDSYLKMAKLHLKPKYQDIVR